MKVYPVISIVDEMPTFEVPMDRILADCKAGGALQVLSPLEAHTARQRAWYKGICLVGLSEWNGDSKECWDRYLKRNCHGIDLLKRETILAEDGTPVTRLTIKGVGKRNMTAFIEEILTYCRELELPVTPPDPELRK